MDEYDIVIVGSGPGGHSCALRAREFGLKVAIVEKNKVGGVCANVGCIPTKSLAASAELARKTKIMKSCGIDVGEIKFDFSTTLKRARQSAAVVSQGVNMLLKNSGVEYVQGEARIEAVDLVIVGERKFKTKNIVIATGGAPIALPGVNFGKRIISGEELVHLEDAPKKVIIIGGGVEGVEYAGILSSFGIDVTIIEMFDRVIASVDKEAAELVAKSLTGLGVKILTGTKVEKINETEVTANGEKLTADLIIIAIGKRPNISEDIKKLGIITSKKGIEVNSQMQTSIQNIYAVGDVVGGGLAHVASEQGIVVAENIAGIKSEYDGTVVPYCIFTVPEVAVVGDVSGENASIGNFPFAALGRATATGERIGFVKVFVNDKKLVGTVIVGPHASDLIGEAALAVKLRVGAEEISKTIHAHPTFPEAFQEAVRNAIYLAKK